MTREDAIHFANCLKNNYTVDLNDMEAFCDMAIKALEQEPILDKIRAEIVEMRSKQNCSCADCLDIIDKYKAETEEV